MYDIHAVNPEARASAEEDARVDEGETEGDTRPEVAGRVPQPVVATLPVHTPRSYPVVPRDKERLDALGEYGILDTPEDPAFNDLARIAATLCNAPVAMVNLVDHERQFMKAAYGFTRRDVPRELSFCAHAIIEPARVLAVPDLASDARFESHPIVAGAPHLRFYAAAPIVTEDGYAIGTVCVMDVAPRSDLTSDDAEALRAIARQAMSLIELRRDRAMVRNANQRLEEANARLEDVSRRKTEIISDVSHEFRTPLTTILGYAELIRDEKLDLEETREFADDIVRDVQRLTRMMENVLDLERLEARATAFRPMPVELPSLLEDEVGRWEVDEAAANHAVSLSVKFGLPQVLADADRIAQVVRNFLANAVKYSPDGGAVDVRAELTTDGKFVRVSVADHGIGISPDGQARIFERFARTQEAIGRGIRGTGLGLAICRQIVELHGGKIGVESVVGQGSTFWFTVPVVDASRV
jgi:signal transduction histidine kinase